MQDERRAVKAWLRGLREAQGLSRTDVAEYIGVTPETIKNLECVMDGDEFHWKCIASVRQDDQLYTLSTNVTCDAGNGQCISEPQSFAPSG